ncbi:hypothetical protein FZC79_17265 [Rossellomorea vietnamensis]|uniref:Uncharacterized protein n=1 Tax=Rossellomorea vietnamensis TaxID=218284 RepID=A0A5D4K919_9BACI|nr:hypothetical protein [Rossellomorea vietnamensis]TYR73867.1 hypothetical protein FZC79_17265 [Rossellomorea vietnamensis]
MEEWQNLFEKWQQENKLLNVEYLIERKGKFSLTGRLLQYSPANRIVIFYDDDTKTVLSLHLNQIENISQAID